MKSRIVILSMLVLGMLLSTAGAGLAVPGLSGDSDNASIAVYGEKAPSGGGDVLGDEDSGNNALPEESSPAGGNDTQPARQVEAGATTSQLPFTGFAAIPVLIGGVALLSVGLVLRRRTGEQR